MKTEPVAIEVEFERPPLYPAQQRAIFDCRDIANEPARYGVIEASTKAGKAQPLDALVYTPAGPKRMGEIVVGDLVLTPDGGSARVIGVYPQGTRPIYRFTFSDGSQVEADLEHLWEVHEFGTQPAVRTTRELMAFSERRLRRTWLPRVEPVGFEAQAVPLDPYLVGVLIGDGGLTTEIVRVASADEEIVDAVRSALPDGHELVHEGRADYRITAGSDAASLRESGKHLRGICLRLGLGVPSHAKRIPKEYRYNSLEVRRAVLQGILDTDGFVDKHGQPAIEQTSEALARDIEELVASLGGTVLTRYRANNGYRKNGEYVACKPVWRQVIRFPDARWCFRLTRKAEKVRPKAKTGHRFLRSIEFAREADAQCIEIDHSRHLYLTDYLVPTHNTVGCMAWLTEQAHLRGKPGRNFWWVAPVYPQAKIAYRRIKAGLPRGSFVANESELTIKLLRVGSTLWFKSAEKPDNLYGEDVYAAVVDEASRCREEAWTALRSTLTATRGPVRIIGNVKGRTNWHYRLARRAEAGEIGYAYAKLTAYDAVAGGVLDMEEIEDAKRSLPERVFRELYLAEPSDDGGNPFGMSAIERCLLPSVSERPAVAIGVDLAKSQDWTVVVGLDRAGHVCGFERWQSSWEQTEKRILSLIGSTPTLIDSTGVGDPIVERLQRLCPTVYGFKFTAQSKQKLMEGLTVALQQGRVGYPDGPIRQELDTFEYRYTRTGAIYTAPEGLHDDCVVALALALEQYRQVYGDQADVSPGGSFRISPWISSDEDGEML